MTFLWERYTAGSELSASFERSGGALQALRRGRHVEPGQAPQMWAFYTQLDEQGRLTRRLRAEHVCLTTFGVHQSGVRYPVHQPDVAVGHAFRVLRESGVFSVEAVDRHVERLATAAQMDEVSHHLVVLVNLMKATKRPVSFDYTWLFRDLRDLQDPLSAARVRRRWGAAYFAHRSSAHDSKEKSS